MYIGYFSYRGLLNSPYFSVSLYLNVEILCDMEEHFSDDDGSMLSRQFDEPFVFDMLDAELSRQFGGSCRKQKLWLLISKRCL